MNIDDEAELLGSEQGTGSIYPLRSEEEAPVPERERDRKMTDAQRDAKRERDAERRREKAAAEKERKRSEVASRLSEEERELRETTGEEPEGWDLDEEPPEAQAPGRDLVVATPAIVPAHMQSYDVRLAELKALGRMRMYEAHMLGEDDLMTYLAAIATHGLLNKAAYAIRRSPKNMRKLIKEDESVRELVEEAQATYKESFRSEIVRRGRDGIIVPVWGKEGRIGLERRYSDRLLEFEAKAAMPERYGDKVDVSITTRPGVLVVPPQAASAEEWEKVHGPAASGQQSAAPKLTRRAARLPKATGDGS